MAEYIERDKVLEEIDDMISNIAFTSPYQREIEAIVVGMERTRDRVEDAPAADVAPVRRGEWLLRHVGHGHYWECSACHTNPCIYVTKDTKFCPNCGADMRGDTDG